MFGAILGDMIGAPYEFDRGDKTKDFPMFSDVSQYTDDTVMTIAVAEALLDTLGEPDEVVKAALVASMQKWGKRYPNAGYGGMFYRWLRTANPKPYGSFGNGSAMRVSSAGWLYDTLEATRHAACLTAEVTHNHPEGIKGAEATASAIWLARNGKSKEEIRDYILREFGYDLSRTCDQIRPGYHHGDRGFEQNFRKAVELYNMAAENGNRQAQRNLGYCYYYGRDMDVDYEKAFHYFALGAFDGYLISLYKIGDMYLHGYYVKKNEKEAFLIYKRCLAEMTTEEHSFVAGPVHLRLGNMYLNGVGTEQDTEEALLHYSIAEIALFKMVKDGDYMYKKSLQSAIKGQEKARALLAKELPEQEWTFDDQRYSPENTSERTERDHVFVRADDHATRQRIIDDLESRGFTVDNRDRQEILESRFPLTVNMAKKTYSAMGNVTCAAAAVSSGHLMTVEEFYAKYLG